MEQISQTAHLGMLLLTYGTNSLLPSDPTPCNSTPPTALSFFYLDQLVMLPVAWSSAGNTPALQMLLTLYKFVCLIVWPCLQRARYMNMHYSEYCCTFRNKYATINIIGVIRNLQWLCGGSTGAQPEGSLWVLPQRGQGVILEFFKSIMNVGILYLFIIGFYIPPTCANTSKRPAGLRVWCLGPFTGF